MTGKSPFYAVASNIELPSYHEVMLSLGRLASPNQPRAGWLALLTFDESLVIPKDGGTFESRPGNPVALIIGERGTGSCDKVKKKLENWDLKSTLVLLVEGSASPMGRQSHAFGDIALGLTLLVIQQPKHYPFDWCVVLQGFIIDRFIQQLTTRRFLYSTL